MEGRAVLFDLDGTLCDLRALHFQALNKALAESGFKEITHDEHVSTYDGLPTEKKLDLLGIPSWARYTVYDRKQTNTMSLIREFVVPDWRLNKEVAKIGREAFVAVVSNARNETCVSVLLRSRLGPYVKMLIAGPHARPKPDKEPYEKALIAAHLDPSQTIAVEDNHYGAESAERAGIRCLRVSGPSDISYDYVMSVFDVEVAV